MRRHGSRRRREDINWPLPWAQDKGPDEPATPTSDEVDASTPAISGSESLPLIHGEVDFEPVPEEGDHIDPLNGKPLA